MKNRFLLFFISISIFSCTNNTTYDSKEITDNRIALRTDTMVIFESTCRGCAYENSTSFAIEDSMDIVKLADIVTTDNSPADMDGGSISKDLILIPLKTGTTNIKIYKFWSQEKTAKDSANFTSCKIEVKP